MFSRYLRFRVDFLVIWKNGLIKKIWLISKFMTSQTEQQIITIHILFNISRGKGNQTMKFGQIDEQYKKYFSWKIIQKTCWKGYSHAFLWKVNIEHISGPTVGNVKNCFLLYVKVEVYQNILKLRCWPLVFTLHKAFLKYKKGSGTSLSRGSMCIVIICSSACDIMDFEINLKLLIKLLLYKIK